MPVIDLINAGTNRTIALLAARGASDDEIRGVITHNFGPQPTNTMNAAIASGRAALLAGQRYTADDYEFAGFTLTVPSAGNIFKGWRYYAQIEVSSPDGSVRTARMLEMDFDSQKTREELYSALEDKFRQLYPSDRDSPDSVPVPDNFFFVDVQVVSVERR